MKDLKDLTQSKKWGAVLAIFLMLAVAFIIFKLGETVGYHKAAFEYHYGDDYYRSFGPGGNGALPGEEDMPGSHGISGTIIRVEPPYAFIEGPDSVEKAIRIGSSTTIVKYHSNESPNDLSDGDFIVVIGSPDASSSEIDAHFVRVLPPATSSPSSR